MSQTAQIGSAGAAGIPATPADTSAVAADWKQDGVEIRPADGLRGSVGLYEVTANGHTRYLPREEAEDLKRALASTPDATAACTLPAGVNAAPAHAQPALFSSPDATAHCGPNGCFTDDDIHAPAGQSSWAARANAPVPTRDVEGAPGRSYDISRMTKGEIDALKKSRDPAQARLGQTIENAKVAYADLIARGGRIVATTSEGNGKEAVLVVMGPGFDPKQPARVHTHYHGDNATVADGLGSKAGTGARIREVVARDPQTVFVLPESRVRAGVQAPDSARHNVGYKASWLHVTSQVRTTDDALDAAGITKVSKDVVSFHSRGGEAIEAIMAHDRNGRGLRADRIELHDCLYGSRDDIAHWARTDNGRDVGRVIFYRGSNASNAHELAQKALGSKFTKVEMGQQPRLDDTTNPVHRDPDGKTYKRTYVHTHQDGSRRYEVTPLRQFDRDPHYRTTGQFLDAYQ